MTLKLFNDPVILRPIRMIVLDIDGTLMDSTDHIRPRVRDSVREAMDSGCLVTLATGRRLVGARQVAADLGVALPLILQNGSLVQDSVTEAVIFQSPLEPETVEAVVDEIVRHGRQPIVVESPAFGGRLYSGDPTRDNDPTRRYDRLRGPYVRVDDDDLRAIRHVLSISTLDVEGGLADLAVVVARIPGTYPLRSMWRMFDYEALEVFRAGCSKASAIEQVAAAHNITMDEVMAIGDGLNDLEMLAAVGLGVAMGNAEPAARAAARVQVRTNDEDGVAEAIDRFLFGRNS